MTQMAKAVPGRWLAISVLAVLVISLAALGAAQPVAGQEGVQVTGRVVQDMDGDGKIGDGDESAETLVDLQDLSVSAEALPTSLFTNADGQFQFQFTDAPTADYRLWVWWESGFIEPEARIDSSLDVERPHDDLVQITLPSERIAAGDLQDLVFLVNPRDPEGPIPFPVTTGPGLPPTHTPAEVAGDCTALPDTGTGSGASAGPWPTVALAALVVAGVLGVAVALSRRKGVLSAR